MQYNDGEFISQYGPQFNWMKYISPASDGQEQNVEAFIDESGEISFEILREIERGQELLYMFGKQHHQNDKPAEQQQQGKVMESLKFNVAKGRKEKRDKIKGAVQNRRAVKQGSSKTEQNIVELSLVE